MLRYYTGSVPKCGHVPGYASFQSIGLCPQEESFPFGEESSFQAPSLSVYGFPDELKRKVLLFIAFAWLKPFITSAELTTYYTFA